MRSTERTFSKSVLIQTIKRYAAIIQALEAALNAANLQVVKTPNGFSIVPKEAPVDNP
jgi:hypothetical protein